MNQDSMSITKEQSSVNMSRAQEAVGRLSPHQFKELIDGEFAEKHKTFQILRRENIGNFTIMKVEYAECPHSIKVMVYRTTVIDACVWPNPHFGEIKSPIARFQPDDVGWALAQQLVKRLNEPTVLEAKPVVTVNESDSQIYEQKCADLIQQGYVLVSASCGFINSESYDYCSSFQAILASLESK